MIWQLAFSAFVIIVFCSFMITFRHEINKNWWLALKETIPLLLAMVAMVALMVITNYVHHLNITLNIAGAAL